MLVRLYPAAFRSRWGPALEHEIRAGGWRAWPNLLAGIADMWLHPVVWPAESRAQRCRRAATMAVAVSAVCWFVTHAVMELHAPLSARIAGSWPMSVCSLLMLLGLALVAPRPRMTRIAMIAVVRCAAARFAVPVTLGAGAVVCVHTGASAAAPTPLRPALFACWWTALALAAIQSCRIIAALGQAVVVPPRPGNLRLGLWILAAAVTAPGPILLRASTTNGHLDLLSAVSGAGLLVLAPAFAGTLRDVRHLTPAD
ncbi:hypothetical protein NE236_18105 [Actinoallomurus purpureus]|uniref:hypothetical protein n=1 Tax=Actinoallomurus purpureus TaxID=478114 RepID=UPI002093DA35|nr:hypothetical protein [Actinoallomurus purpureus]MCO6006904.1 hypothetical protein [Actinoallomurus purpureus]